MEETRSKVGKENRSSKHTKRHIIYKVYTQELEEEYKKKKKKVLKHGPAVLLSLSCDYWLFHVDLGKLYGLRTYKRIWEFWSSFFLEVDYVEIILFSTRRGLVYPR
jgi:hypothetical protein